MNPELQNYIDNCRASGFSDEEIRLQLHTAGWSDELVAQAFSPKVDVHQAVQTETLQVETLFAHSESTVQSEAKPAKPARTARVHFRKYLIPTSIALGVVIVLFGTGVAFAEHGYLPGFSKLYRKTPLPLLWHGTYGKASVSLGKMLLNTTSSSIGSSAAKFSFTVDKIDKAKGLQLGDSKIFSSLAFLSDSGNTLADVPQCQTSPCAQVVSDQFNIDSLLPLSFSADLGYSQDASKNTSLTASLDFTDIAKLLPKTTITPTASSKLTFATLLFPGDKQALVKSNLIPYQSVPDKGKWLRIDVPQSYLDTFMHPDTSIMKNLSDSDTKALAAIIDAVGTDNGIIRDNGTAYAKYTLRLDKNTLIKLQDIKALSDYKSDFKDVADAGDFTLDAVIEMTPETAQLHSVDLTFSEPDTASNVRFSLSMSEVVSYGVPSIDKPASTDTIPNGENYVSSTFNTAVQNLMDGTVYQPDTDWFGNSAYVLSVRDILLGEYNSAVSQSGDIKIKAMNATRKSDITELGKAIEFYKMDDSNVDGLAPTTNGVIENLDDPNNILAQDPKFIAIVNKIAADPEVSTYHYTYVSTGKNYTLTCVQIDPVTGKVSGHFMIQDGNSISDTISTNTGSAN